MTLVGGFAFGWACWLVLWVYFSAARSEFGGKKKNPVPGIDHFRERLVCVRATDMVSKNGCCFILRFVRDVFSLLNVDGNSRLLSMLMCRVLPGLDRFQTQRSSFKPGSWLEI